MDDAILFQNYSKDGETSTEIVLWAGKSTQWINFKHFFLSTLVFVGITVAYLYNGNDYILYAYIVPFFTAFWAWLYVQTTQYVLTNHRIVKKHGILNRYTFDVELYRVKDVLLIEQLFLRILGFGSIRLVTSQKTTENFTIPGIRKAKALREQIRKLVEERRINRGVREFDTN